MNNLRKTLTYISDRRLMGDIKLKKNVWVLTGYELCRVKCEFA